MVAVEQLFRTLENTSSISESWDKFDDLRNTELHTAVFNGNAVATLPLNACSECVITSVVEEVLILWNAASVVASDSVLSVACGESGVAWCGGHGGCKPQRSEE
jgi:hypothetical protein